MLYTFRDEVNNNNNHSNFVGKEKKSRVEMRNFKFYNFDCKVKVRKIFLIKGRNEIEM